MNDEITAKTTEIIRDLFDEYDGPVDRALTARAVPQWDSLGHVQLVVMIERTFGIRFKTDEVHRYENLGELIDAVKQKRAVQT